MRCKWGPVSVAACRSHRDTSYMHAHRSNKEQLVHFAQVKALLQSATKKIPPLRELRTFGANGGCAVGVEYEYGSSSELTLLPSCSLAAVPHTNLSDLPRTCTETAAARFRLRCRTGSGDARGFGVAQPQPLRRRSAPPTAAAPLPVQPPKRRWSLGCLPSTPPACWPPPAATPKTRCACRLR